MPTAKEIARMSGNQKVKNNPRPFARIWQRLYGQPHLITGAAFEPIHQAFQRILAGGPMPQMYDINDYLNGEDPPPLAYDVREGVAVVPLKGVMAREISALDKACDGVDVDEIAALLRKADADPSVQAIVLSVDSPGGSVNGTEELAATIGALEKPVISHTAGMAASAGLWAFSQADARYVAESAQVGSVGVYMALLDQSGRFAADGLRQDVIKSDGSPLKAAGIPGTSLSDAQREQMQETVDYLYARFSGAVKAAMPSVKPEALTGGMYFGSKAVEMGLADSVASLDDAIRDARALAGMKKS